MITVLYTRACGAQGQLEALARRAFPSKDNSDYLNEICMRKSEVSATESLTALFLLSTLVKSLGKDTESLILCRGENGKPFFKNSGLEFSISHSKGIVAVAVSDSGKVGIDIEAAEISEENAKKLAERYFTRAENSLVSSPEDFLRIWTEKEAYVKLCGATLSDALSKDTPKGVKFFNFKIFDLQATVCSFDDAEVRIISHGGNYD